MDKIPLNQVLCGNAFELLPKMPPESVDCIVFSPPYWGLRDYHLPPIILSGKADCEHEWQTEQINWNRGSVDKSEKQASNKGSLVFKTDTNFCVHCGAWKGSFGLEFHPQLYIDHMALLCSLLKRVLKRTGGLWINMGSTYASKDIFVVEREYYE